MDLIKRHHTNNKSQVHRVLPYWISHPAVIPGNVVADQTPVESVAEYLDEDIKRILKENGIAALFPVQAKMIPELMTSERFHWGDRPRDICCSAPTGSGKTLAFVIPIVQILKHRRFPGIQCLVVVPVGDLAEQVYRVFCRFCEGTRVKVGLVTGIHSFAKEQASLIKEGHNGYESQVDVVVCTPGRLVDHINLTPGFDLTMLRFLVIDEADRMMEDIKQDWLSKVERSVFRAGEHSVLENEEYKRLNPCACIRKAPGSLTVQNPSEPLVDIPLRKLLFSATLSRQPELLDPLKLYHPKLFTTVHSRNSRPNIPHTVPAGVAVDDMNGVGGVSTIHETEEAVTKKYDTPVGLTEKFIECTQSEKILVLLYLLKHMQLKQMLCFTNSVESTHRLCQLLKLIGVATVQEISSKQKNNRRGRFLRQFAAGKINVLICSDSMSRGMDIENVQCVVQYDVSTVIKRYIHRVGRTARAGKPGMAVTLLEKKEVFHFKQMLKKGGKEGIKEMKLKNADLKPFVASVQKALVHLPEVLKMQNSVETCKQRSKLN